MNAVTLKKTGLPLERVIRGLAESGNWLIENRRELRASVEAARREAGCSPRAALAIVERALVRAHSLQLVNATETFNSMPLGAEDDFESPESYRAEVAKQLALLIGSYPTANIPEPTVFTSVLLEDVLTEGADLAALSSACAEIRRTQRFVPSISEVLAVVKKHQELWWARMAAADATSEYLARLTSMRTELRERVADSEPDACDNRPITGARVSHIKFGQGTVEETERGKLSIRFDQEPARVRIVAAGFVSLIEQGGKDNVAET